MIVYHRNQERYIGTLNRYRTRLDTMPRLTIGLPNLWPEWQVVDRSRDRTGTKRRFAARDSMSTKYIHCWRRNLSVRATCADGFGGTEFSEAILHALRGLRPKATLLIRPHPRAFREHWFEQAIAELGDARVRVSLVHPDALVALSRRVIAPNTSTIMFRGRSRPLHRLHRLCR